MNYLTCVYFNNTLTIILFINCNSILNKNEQFKFITKDLYELVKFVCLYYILVQDAFNKKKTNICRQTVICLQYQFEFLFCFKFKASLCQGQMICLAENSSEIPNGNFSADFSKLFSPSLNIKKGVKVYYQILYQFYVYTWNRRETTHFKSIK